MTRLPITHRSATALAAGIRAREISSAEVVAAHVDVLRRAQPRTNAVVADRFAQALEEAARVDERIAAAGPGDALPPLLGVPFTVKESIALRGMPNAAGLPARRAVRSLRSAPVVQRVLDAGAIALGVTNTPELCMWIETSNRLYGRTNNAYDARRTAGGSSGGEGAAVGSGGSPFGIGSDIGGSIRIPAFFNGVFGHKASVGVVPSTGQWPLPAGDASLMLALGPLARRAEDLWPLLALLAGPDGEDAYATVDPARLGDPGSVGIEGLPVALIERGGPLPVARELRETLHRAADALSAAGAQVRTTRMPALRRAYELYMTALSGGAGVTLLETLADGGSPLTKRAVARAALRRSGDHTIPILIAAALEAIPGIKTPRRVARAKAAADRLRDAVAAEIGDGVLLYPPHPRVAPMHNRPLAHPVGSIVYTAVFNLLGLPVTQAPAGLGSSGVPLGLQVVGAPLADHVTIAVAMQLERALGGWAPPALPAESETPVRAEPIAA